MKIRASADGSDPDPGGSDTTQYGSRRARSDLPELILASGSARRRELLDALDVVFTIRPVNLDESTHPDEPAPIYVERLARAKAAAHVSSGELVLAADTVVVVDGLLLGKPSDPDHAADILRHLAGREHQVLTGVALNDAGERTEIEVSSSRVRIQPMTRHEIAWYVATGEPLDKAGAYGIQGLGALFVESLQGNYTNVVGLPLPAVCRLFRGLGYDLRDFRRSRGLEVARLDEAD